jgi:hypothetical protein
VIAVLGKVFAREIPLSTADPAKERIINFLRLFIGKGYSNCTSAESNYKIIQHNMAKDLTGFLIYEVFLLKSGFTTP